MPSTTKIIFVISDYIECLSDCIEYFYFFSDCSANPPLPLPPAEQRLDNFRLLVPLHLGGSTRVSGKHLIECFCICVFFIFLVNRKIPTGENCHSPKVYGIFPTRQFVQENIFVVSFRLMISYFITFLNSHAVHKGFNTFYV